MKKLTDYPSLTKFLLYHNSDYFILKLGVLFFNVKEGTKINQDGIPQRIIKIITPMITNSPQKTNNNK